MQSIRKRLGMTLHNDDIGDPITVVTKRNAKSITFFTRDIRVLFPRKRSVLSAYDQQRAPVKIKDDTDSHRNARGLQRDN